jgi:hypothetical protein
MVAAPITNGSFSVGAPAPPLSSSAGSTTTGATAPGTGQITSTGSVNVTTTNTTTTTPATTPTTGILATGNNLSGQPLLESSLLNN